MTIGGRNRLLGVLVLVLGGLTWLDARGGPRAVDRGPWLAGLDPARVARMRVACGGSEVELERADGAWVVPTRARFPAESSAVDELLARVAAVRASDRVSSDPATHERLGVGAGAVAVTLLDAGGTLLEELLLGRASEPPSGEQRDAGGTSLRRAGEDDVFRAAALALPACEASRWLEARLADFAPPEVQRFAASIDGERFELIRLSDGRWQAGERLLAPARVNPVLLVAANLFLEDLADIEPAVAGLAPPASSIELGLAGARAVRVELGAELPGGGRAARRGDFDPSWVARLPRSAAERLEAGLRQVLADLAAGDGR